MPCATLPGRELFHIAAASRSAPHASGQPPPPLQTLSACQVGAAGASHPLPCCAVPRCVRSRASMAATVDSCLCTSAPTIHAPDSWRRLSPPHYTSMPSLPTCWHQVLVNHLYKVVYLRHAKTASSSLLCHFRGCRAGDDGGGQASAVLSFEPLQVHARCLLAVKMAQTASDRLCRAAALPACELRQGSRCRAVCCPSAQHATAWQCCLVNLGAGESLGVPFTCLL